MHGLARMLLWLLAIAVLLLGARMFWDSRWMEVPRTTWELSRMPRPSSLPVPVQGVEATRIADTFGAPRGRDRMHQGVDIFAPRGTPVRSTTRGVVVSVREGGLGGRQVWVLGPAGERHYYAHLEAWAPQLAEHRIVQPGDVLGFVGDSGNAKGTPPHLHYGIYGPQGAYDALPQLRAGAGQAATR
jgi:murein DD-endopeptidase MepM/ murein hydrolase activator NlpD